MDDVFTEDYFMRGKEKHLSLYENYHWLGQPTLDMARSIAKHICLDKFQTVLDFGCARGYLVRALREQNYKAWGTDISAWALENSDRNARPFLARDFFDGQQFNWVIAKDVLEHVHDLGITIDGLLNRTRHGLFAVVPLAATDGAPYVVEDYEKDVTHIHRYTLGTWINKFMRPGWRVEAQFLVPGVKCNYAQFPTGNGFIKVIRL